MFKISSELNNYDMQLGNSGYQLKGSDCEKCYLPLATVPLIKIDMEDIQEELEYLGTSFCRLFCVKVVDQRNMFCWINK